jgi:two-component system, NarL family, sensor histidine kinase UhpB
LQRRFPGAVTLPLPRSLFWRVALCNGAIFAAAVLMLALSPATVSSPLLPEEAELLGLGALGVILLNAFVLRRALAPVKRLASHMQSIDPLAPDAAAPPSDGSSEIVALTDAFNDMLARLRAERRESSKRALRAEEAERRRVAQELHDDVGQSLTVLLLELSRAKRERSDTALADAQGTARALLEDVRHICHELRPESLDDLGLPNAVRTLAQRVSEAAGMPVDVDVDDELDGLSPEAELVVLRVAQESLTNVVRHARASSASVSLGRSRDGVCLRVVDDGRGLSVAKAGSGIRGMRERAMSIGAELALLPSQGQGLEVRLELGREHVVAA